MDHVSSAAFSILLPMGAANDPEGREGSANVLADLYNKGAGEWDSKQLSQECESIGLQRNHGAGIEVSVFSGVLLSENIIKALELYATVLLRPRFPGEELDSVTQLALQDLKALEDRPNSKVMSELGLRFYPEPFGRSLLGTKEGISSLEIDGLRKHYERNLLPAGTIISVAGKFDWKQVVACIERNFGALAGEFTKMPVGKLPGKNQSFHLEKDTSQLQIALAYPSVSIDHPQYYAARLAVGVLSGGMSGRLFIEVREKRGLVYSVSASHSASRDRAAIFATAGTTPENGEETLSVMIDELKGLENGVSDEELKRAKADIKSRLVMQSELSSVRCSALVNDWWNLGRLRQLEEIQLGIDSVTANDIVEYSKQNPVDGATLVTLGSKELELSL
jgi:predicted Zn-dependent peptidase